MEGTIHNLLEAARIQLTRLATNCKGQIVERLQILSLKGIDFSR